LNTNVLDSLMQHRSIRSFEETGIPGDIITQLLEVAIRAPTAGGLQHYSLLVVDDAVVLAQLDIEAPLAIVALVDEHRTRRWFEDQEAPFRFVDAVSFFIGFSDALFALHNLAVAAEGVGLGTCYLGDALTWDAQLHFNAPAHVVSVGCLLLGSPAEHPAIRPRLPLDAVVHRNRYCAPTKEQIRRWYKAKDKEFHDFSAAEKSELAALGIKNRAQELAIDCYPEAFLREQSAVLRGILERAGFRLRG